MLLYTWTSFNL